MSKNTQNIPMRPTDTRQGWWGNQVRWGGSRRPGRNSTRCAARSPSIHNGIQLYLFCQGYSKVFTKEAVYFYPHGAGEVSSTKEGRMSQWRSQDRAAAALWLDTRPKSCLHWHFPRTSTGQRISSIASILAFQRRQQFNLILLFFVSYKRNQNSYAPNQVWAKQL